MENKLRSVIGATRPRYLLYVFRLDVNYRRSTTNNRSSLPRPIRRVRPTFRKRFGVTRRSLNLLPRRTNLNVRDIRDHVRRDGSRYYPINTIRGPLRRNTLVICSRRFRAISPSFFYGAKSVNEGDSALTPPPQQLLMGTVTTYSP